MLRATALVLLSSPLLAQAPDQEAIEDRLAEHALFSRLELTRTGETGPHVALLVEAPRRPSDTHLAAVEELFAPWLARLDQVLVASYVTPNTLEREDGSALGVVVCANTPTFRNVERYQETRDHLSARCPWIADPGVVVTLWNERMARVPAHEVREPLLRRVVARLLATYHRGEGDLPAERWVVEGLGGYLSACGEEATPDDLAHPPAHAGALARTLPRLAGEGPELVLPIEVLVASSDRRARGQAVLDAGASLPAEEIEQLFRDQAALWVHFLERGEGGRFLAGWRHYVAKVLHDNGSARELANTLGAGLEELNLGFRRHLEGLAGGAGRGGPVTIDEGAVLHEGLVQPALEVEAVLADTLGRAALGDLEAALAFTEAGMRALGGEERGRVAAERDRLRDLRATRDAYLAALVEEKDRLRWTDAAGERHSARVTGREDGVLLLEEGERRPVSSLGAEDLARSMGRDVAEYGPAWVDAYLDLLAGDERWDRGLDTGSPEGAALAADEALPGLVAEGRRRARLARLARTPLPEKPAEVRARLAEIAELAAAEGSPSVEVARPGLRALAAVILGRQWDTTGLRRRLKGDLETEGDRVRIVYEFDDPEELEDFASADGYLQERAVELPPVQVAEPGWKVKGGNLEGRGAVALRHLVGLEAPLEVRYQLLYGRAQPGQALNATLLMAVCDDGDGSYVGAWDLFDLEAIDRATGYVRTAYEQGERKIPPARSIDVELEHDGEKAHLRVGGRDVREVATGKRDRGTTLLWMHGDAVIAVRRLEIRGTLLEDTEDPARAAWVEEELGKLGF